MVAEFHAVSLRFSEEQLRRLKKALSEREQITLRFNREDLEGHGDGFHEIMLGKRNAERIKTAMGKDKGLDITLTKGEVKKNSQKGGFLSGLLNILSGPVGAIAGPVLGAVASGIFNKIFGSSSKPDKASEDNGNEGAGVTMAGVMRDSGDSKEGGLLYATPAQVPTQAGMGMKTKMFFY